MFKVCSLETARSGLNFKEALDSGFSPVENFIQTRSRAHGHPGSTPIYINMVADGKTGRLLGVQMLGKKGVGHRINSIALMDFFQTDLAYEPPFGPVWDPLLTATGQLAKKI